VVSYSWGTVYVPIIGNLRYLVDIKLMAVKVVFIIHQKNCYGMNTLLWMNAN